MWKLTKKVLRNKTIRITFSDNGVVKTLILLGYESIWIFKELVVFCYIPPPPHFGPEYFQEQILTVTPWSRSHEAPSK